MASLKDRIKKASKISFTNDIEKSEILSKSDVIPTDIPALNIAFSGSLSGGLTTGLTMFAGPSATFKSLYALVCAKAYLDKYDDAVMLFYDSEMGSSLQYFKSVGIDTERVVHSPITNVEELKFDLMAQLEQVQRGDHLVVLVDSIGNLASKKEVEDSLNEKSAADMTRAKQLKSIVRMITPVLNLKNIPMIVINHTYESLELYSTTQISGGTGIVYGCQNIFITGKSQEKKGTELVGYNFTLNIRKSRFSREKTRIPITVTFDGGINKWSGLLEMAVAAGVVVKPSNGWYQRVNSETGEVEEKKYRAAETNTEQFWAPLLASEAFNKWIENTFKIAHSGLLVDNEEECEKPHQDFIAEG